MWELGAALLPYVINAMTPRPDAPGAPAPVVLPDRSKYQDMILQSGFNPQSELYNIATQRAMNEMNNQLINRGLASSSFGLNQLQSTQAELANKFLENEIQRRIQAFQAATGYDMQAAGIQQNNNQAAYNHDMARYQREVGDRNAMVGGIGNLVNAGIGVYRQYQGDQQAALREANAQKRFDMMMGGGQRSPVAPSGGAIDYGVPSFSYNSPTYGKFGG